MINIIDPTEEICGKIQLSRRFVYIIQMINTSYYKVGISDNTEARLIALQHFNPFDLKIIYSKEFEDAEPIETYLHNFFIKNHVRGEWFEFVASDLFDIVRFLKTLEYSNDIKNEIKRKLRLQKSHKQKIKKSRHLIQHKVRLVPTYPVPSILTEKTGMVSVYFRWKVPETGKPKLFKYKLGINREKDFEVRQLKAEAIKCRLIRLFECGLNPLDHPQEFKKLA